MFVSIQECERVYLCHFWNVCIKTGKWASLTPSLLKCLYQYRNVSEFNSITFEMFGIKTGKWTSLSLSLLKCLYQYKKVSDFISVTFEMFVSIQESERVYLCHFWNVCINTGMWASLTPSLLKCLYQDRKVSEFISVTFEMFVSIQESERVYLCHFWNVCIMTGKWVSLTPSLLKCLYHDRKVSEFNSITFEMSVSRRESERVYLCHFWNVCIKTGKWVSLTPSLLKCLYQDRKVSEFISVTFEMFVSRQESEWV